MRPTLKPLKVISKNSSDSKNPVISPKLSNSKLVSKAKKLKANVGTKSAEDYKSLTPHEMVLQRPETYIGSDVSERREERVYNLNTGRFQTIHIDMPVACIRLLLEPLANAADNVHESRSQRVNPGKIQMWMNSKTVTIKNYGITIPIQKSVNHHEDIYIPELIFGTVFSSSNYDDRKEFKTKKKIRTGLGKNGIGIKATNIFSKKFVVCIKNSIMKLSYTQEWNDNMFVRKPPIIEPYDGEESSTCISYDMDFDYFNLPYTFYEPEIVALYCRHLLDISFTAKIPVSFNDIEFNLSDIKEFAKLCFDAPVVESAIIHIQWPEDSEPKDRKNYKYVIPHVEMMLIDDPNNGCQFTFANCIATVAGIHVETAFKAISGSVLEKINEPVLKDLALKYKGTDIPLKEKKACTLTLADVKKHVSMILSVQVLSPLFGSQLKDDLKGPAPNIVVKPTLLKNIENWNLIDFLKRNLDSKIDKIFEKETKSRKGRLTKGIHANLQGTAEKGKCTLILVEGESALSYPNFMFSNNPKLRDYYGILAMKGKLINSINNSAMMVKNNKEVKELSIMLGLVPGTDYSLDENFNKLNYGSVLGMGDPDEDAIHCVSLIFLFFSHFYPSLLKRRNFFKIYRPPMLRAWKNKTQLKFYSKYEFDTWVNSCNENIKSWKIHYYKGLGTSTKEDVKDDMTKLKITELIYDDKANNNIHKVFNKKFAEDRKKWILDYIPKPEISLLEEEAISLYIDYELIQYSLEDIRRSIPKYTDGLKESQRKILFGAYNIKGWNIAIGNSYSKLKVAQFGSACACSSAYKHGENSLLLAIIGMSQSFVSSNNIPYFTEDGGFGSYEKLGKDAASPRYIFCRPRNILPYLFRTEDLPVLDYVFDEGSYLEPITYYPILPQILINGCEGVATGWSSYINMHDPLVLCQYIRQRLRNENDNLPKLLPWYRNYAGVISLIDRCKENNSKVINIVGNSIVSKEEVPDMAMMAYNKEIDESIKDLENAESQLENLESDLESKKSLESKESLDFSESSDSLEILPQYSMLSYGNFSVQDDNTIIVTEMPLFRSADNYRQWLNKCIDDKVISHFHDYTADNIILFKIYGFTKQPSHINLRLVSRRSLTNMVLLDDNDKPRKYSGAQEIMEEYIQERIKIYAKRKDYNITKINEEIQDKIYRMKFIQSFCDKKLLIENQKDEFIYQQLDNLEIPREYLDKIHLRHCTKLSIEKLQKEISEKNAKKIEIENTSESDMWLSELDEFEKAYHKEFPNVYDLPSLDVDSFSNNNIKKKRTRKTVVKKDNKVIKPKVKKV